MGDLKKYTILIADDDDDLRRTIVFDFKRKGFTVLDANSGDSAFELVTKNKVDMVVSDIRMPGGDGISLLERIRVHNPSLPVLVFITGFSDISEEECLSKGAKKVLAKPFDRKELMEVVFKALEISDTSAAA